MSGQTFFRPPNRDAYESRFQASSRGRYERTGETRQPEPGEFYIAKNGNVHLYTSGVLIFGDFEILRRIDGAGRFGA